MKTNKYNHMLESFYCDFALATKGKHTLAELDERIKSKDKNLLKDIELLGELEWMIRNGMAEIHIVEDDDLK